ISNNETVKTLLKNKGFDVEKDEQILGRIQDIEEHQVQIKVHPINKQDSPFLVWIIRKDVIKAGSSNQVVADPTRAERRLGTLYSNTIHIKNQPIERYCLKINDSDYYASSAKQKGLPDFKTYDDNKYSVSAVKENKNEMTQCFVEDVDGKRLSATTRPLLSHDQSKNHVLVEFKSDKATKNLVLDSDSLRIHKGIKAKNDNQKEEGHKINSWVVYKMPSWAFKANNR
ncbi:MAG: hypothetical protein GY821_16620, partial [Gammaproteobacteria bacterium]|nr:hypothetical protein [Gammaproteobacteria bacterium]